MGFQQTIGQASSLQAELYALRDGLQMSANFNCRPIEIEVDAATVTILVNNQSEDRMRNYDRFWKHIFVVLSIEQVYVIV